MRGKFHGTFFFALSICGLVLLATACGQDRSGEQPFSPAVESLRATVVGDSAILVGRVTASVNSTLLECGFAYGNDTLRATTTSEMPTDDFSAVTDSLGVGEYFAVAYARNGMGTSYGDTIRFRVGN